MAPQCGSSDRHMSILLVCAAVVLAIASPAFGQSAISACAQVLQQGIYNSVSQSGASQSYQAFQTTVCTYSSTYTYQQYQTDSSSNSASSTWRSIEAAASYMGIWGGSAGGSSGDTHMTASQFSLFQANAAEYQSYGCSATSSSSSSSGNFQYISNWIDPNIISAWQSCIKNFATGTTIQSTTGIGGDSVALSIVFTSTVSGATASLNGYSVTPARAAICTLYGPKVTSSAKTTLMWPLAPSVTYNVYCVINATKLTRAIDVFIYTSPGGYYHAVLYNAPPPTQLAKLQALVSTANQQISNLQGLVSSASQQIASLQSLITSFYKDGVLTTTGLQMVAPDDPGTIRYVISARVSGLQSPASVLTIRDWVAHLRNEDMRLTYGTGYIDLAAVNVALNPVVNPVQTALDAYKLAQDVQSLVNRFYSNGIFTAHGLNLYADDPAVIRYQIAAFKIDNQRSVLVMQDWLAAARNENKRLAYYSGYIDLNR